MKDRLSVLSKFGVKAPAPVLAKRGATPDELAAQKAAAAAAEKEKADTLARQEAATARPADKPPRRLRYIPCDCAKPSCKDADGNFRRMI